MASAERKKVGLIVNPVAGLGGRVGLKGSDGLAIQRRARELGAVPVSGSRAVEALEMLRPLWDMVEIVTYPGEMGEEAAVGGGFSPIIVGSIRPGETTAEDTRRAARALCEMGVDLILFAGGDGTARDICEAIGSTVPVIGIPAGVKIHSAVFGINPASAGELATQFLRGDVSTLRDAEVMDLDEAAYRQGIVSPQLYGYLKIPYRRQLVQARKSPRLASEDAALQAIALDVIDHMLDGYLYIVGPGTTTRPILTCLGLDKTLIGVDVIQGRRLIAADANEAQLLALVEDHPAKVIVTPIGGQGYIFGRGNQPISPAVLRRVGREHIIVVSTLGKILSLNGQPLLVDTGDREVDRMLSGHMKIVTGYGERIVYRIGTGWT